VAGSGFADPNRGIVKIPLLPGRIIKEKESFSVQLHVAPLPGRPLSERSEKVKQAERTSSIIE